MIELLRYLESNGFASYIVSGGGRDFDDGPVKPVRIWGRTGRRPIFAAGNSNGDIQMLQYAGTPALRLLVCHDDAQREFHYTAGAERALELAAKEGWTVVSIKNDWAGVFVD